MFWRPNWVDSSSECVPVLSYLTDWIQQPCYPIYYNPRTDGVQAAFGCSMEALRTPGESTGTAAIARKCSRRDTYTIRTACIFFCMYIHTNDCPLYRAMRLSTKCLMDTGICTRRNQYKWIIHANTSSTDNDIDTATFSNVHVIYWDIADASKFPWDWTQTRDITQVSTRSTSVTSVIDYA